MTATERPTATEYDFHGQMLLLSECEVAILAMTAQDVPRWKQALRLELDVCCVTSRYERLMQRLKKETDLGMGGIPLACRLAYALGLVKL